MTENSKFPETHKETIEKDKEENLLKIMIEACMFSAKNANRWKHVLMQCEEKYYEFHPEIFVETIRKYYDEARKFDSIIDNMERENTKLLIQKAKLYNGN